MKIKVFDIDDKHWEFTTSFTLGQVDEKLGHAVTVQGLIIKKNLGKKNLEYQKHVRVEKIW